jgi:hypothetical protein
MLGAIAIAAMICFTVLIIHNRNLDHYEKCHNEEQNPTGVEYAVSNLRTRIDSFEVVASESFDKIDKNNKEFTDKLSVILKKLSELDDYKKKVDALVLKAGFKL